MNRLCVVVATLSGITACATSVPEPPESPEPAAQTEDAATKNSSAATVDELQVVDIPELGDTPILANNDNPNELVCRYERETGTHMRTRVCRWQAQIEASRKSAKKTVREMGMPRVTSMPPDH